MGRLLTLLTRSVRSYTSDKCPTLASSIAYHTVFALFPMALIGVSVLGFFVGDAAARQQVAKGFTTVITLGDEGRAALEQTLAGVNRAKGWLGLVGLLTALWSVSGLFGALRSALDSVWDVDRPLPVLRAKVRDLLLFGGFGGLLFASTASTGVLQGAREVGANWLGPLLDLAAPAFALLAILAPLTLSFAAFLVLYRFGPHTRLRWRDVWPAAALVAVGYEFGKNLLAFYIRHLGNFNALAGSLGAAILFLAFVYYAAQGLLFAAELTKHWLLIQAETVPDTDATAARPKASVTERVKGMLVRLWRVEQPHHDHGLPYAPGRLDPATNRPTNTREEVLFRRQEAREHAAQDAGEPPAHVVGEGQPRGSTVPVAGGGDGSREGTTPTTQQ